jgi:hypothetical protein
LSAARIIWGHREAKAAVAANINAIQLEDVRDPFIRRFSVYDGEGPIAYPEEG